MPGSMKHEERHCPRCGALMIAIYPHAENEEERKAIRKAAIAGTLKPQYECIRCGSGLNY